MRLVRTASVAALGLSAVLLLCSACGSREEAKPRPAPGSPQSSKPAPDLPASEPEPVDTALSEAELAARGRSVYMTNCIACHNTDPSQDGALGPEVTGSSVELLEARVLLGTYPEGYIPKRDTKVMVPLSFLGKEISALAAYLNE